MTSDTDKAEVKKDLFAQEPRDDKTFFLNNANMEIKSQVPKSWIVSSTFLRFYQRNHEVNLSLPAQKLRCLLGRVSKLCELQRTFLQLFR